MIELADRDPSVTAAMLAGFATLAPAEARLVQLFIQPQAMARLRWAGT